MVKIVVIEDEVDLLQDITIWLDFEGFEAVAAKDGEEGLNFIKTTKPDLILCDINMPKMDGFEVLKSVRGDPRLEKLPIIMITSRTGEKHKQQALELGVNQYLGKPFQEAELLKEIEHLIGDA